MGREQGFTLIEVLMALTVFALIAALSYGALDTAGRGFEVLHAVRGTQEQSGWVGRQLRADLRYLSAAPFQMQARPVASVATSRTVPIRIRNDNRGDIDLDQLWLLVQEPGLPSVSQVHYFIDEENGHLMRESRLLLARSRVEPTRWDFGKARSWAVEVLDRQANWRQDWNFTGQAFVWPKAIKVSLQVDDSQQPGSEHEWLVPVVVGSEL